MTSRICSKVFLLFVGLVLLCISFPIFAATTERVSVSSTGEQANNWSGLYYHPSISADGRYVTFYSLASNLVAGDTNHASDIFVQDRLTGIYKIASVSSTGILGNRDSYMPSISANGRYVVFCSDATNLTAKDITGACEIYLHDLITDTTERVSVSSTDEQGNGCSYEPSISADGRYVTFHSGATNFTSVDTNNAYDIFVRDRTSGTTTRVSVSSSGEQANDMSFSPVISANGRYVVYESVASNLVTGDTNGKSDVFIYDLVTSTTKLVSVSLSGVSGNNVSCKPSISGDGRYVAFYSFASDLVTGDNNNEADIFIRDLINNTTTLLSTSTTGELGNGKSSYPSISADGRYVSFYSDAFNLVDEDTNGTSDLFIRDCLTNKTERVNVTSSGKQVNTVENLDCDSPCLNADGRYVVFGSRATDLVPGDTNGFKDVFIRDRANSPINTSLTPNTGTIPIGKKTYLTSVYTDLDGYSNIKNSCLMMNKGSTSSGAGYCFYDAEEDLLYLRDTADDAYIGGYAPGSDQVIDNGCIKLYCAYTTVQTSGDDMMINWCIALEPYFSKNTCTSSMQVTNKAGLSDPMEGMGIFNTLTCKPDMLIKAGTEATYIGENIVSADGSNQTKSQSAAPNQKLTYAFKIKNAGDANDSFKITAPSGSVGWSIKYYDLATGADITSQVTGTGWSSGTLAPGANKGLFATVKPDATVPAGSVNTLLIKAASEADDSKIDVVKAVTTFTANYKTDMLIKNGTDGSYSGTGIYSADGSGQTRSQNVSPNQKVTCAFRARNAGTANDSFRITGPSGGSGWSVKYYDLTTNADVTSQVTGSGWVSGVLAPGVSSGVYANIKPSTSVSLGSSMTLTVTGTSIADNSKIDVVKSVTTCVASYKPDLLIKAGTESSYAGTDIINLDGTDQTKSQNASAGQKVVYSFRVLNAGYLSDSIKITGPSGGSGWSVKYYDLNTNADVTPLVTGAGWVSGILAPGGAGGVYAKVSPDATVKSGTVNTLLITAISVGDGSKQDVVKAVTTVP